MSADPIFTTAQVKQDGRDRVTKTVGQGGYAYALVLIAQEGLRARGWLGGELSTQLFGAYVLVLTGAAAALTNLGKLRGKQ